MKKISIIKFVLLLAVALPVAITVSCTKDEDKIADVITDTVLVTNTDTVTVVEKLPENSLTDYKAPKYIFFFIGDGMSSAQVNLAEAALSNPNFRISKKNSALGEMNIQKLPVSGMQTTNAEDRYITDSAAAGTALATGEKTSCGTVSVKSDGQTQLKTMAEIAKEKGMKVGIISSVSIDHATPACFYAHNESRNNYYEIGQDLIASGFDYFAGGNVRHNKFPEEYTLENFHKDAASNGYKCVNTREGLKGLQVGEKAIATIKKLYTSDEDGCALPYMIDLDEQTSDDDKITLTDFTAKGIELLDNENGFFMMIESGKIDWACHANDAVSATHDLIEFDNAIGKALAFYEEHKEETLIIVTGDHETGGLTIGYAATGQVTAFDKLQHQTLSYLSFREIVEEWKSSDMTYEKALEVVKEKFGLGNEELGLALSPYENKILKEAFKNSMSTSYNKEWESSKIKYGSYDPFTVTVNHVMNNKAGLDFTTFKHTGTPVPVFAIGQGQYEFSGYYDNTDLAKRILKVANFTTAQ